MLAELGIPLSDDFLYGQKISKNIKEDFYLESILLKFQDFEKEEAHSVFLKDDPLREDISSER
jgi:hypothetical protein